MPILGLGGSTPVPPPSGSGNIVDFTNPEGITGTWDFGDGTPTTTDIDPQHEYAVHGVYTVNFTSDTAGSFSQEVTITPLPLPTASFTATPRDPVSNTYDFVGSGGASYEWTFEGNTLTGANVTYTFINDGEQLASLVVTDANNNTDYAQELLNVEYQNQLPTGDWSYVTYALEVTFASAITDPDGEDNNITYLWDFDDGNTSTDANPVHTYANPVTPGDPQTFNVTLTATDERGGVVVVTKSLTVYDTLQYGPDLVADSGFDGATLDAGWAENAISTVMITDEGRSVAHMTGVSTSQAHGRYELTVEIGKLYSVEAEFKANAVINFPGDECSINVFDDGTSLFTESLANGPYGTISTSFIPTTTNVHVRCMVRRTGSEMWINNLRIREVS